MQRSGLRRFFIMVVVLWMISLGATGQRVVWLEAEGFHDTGGWSNDSQHVDLMGSPYLLATGVGRPVGDAVTTANVAAGGRYRLWVRCRDWLPEYHPGLFQVWVGGKASSVTFGKADTDAWQWVDGGAFDLEPGAVEVRLRDLNGWWGRCDAVVLAADSFRPADERAVLAEQRRRYGGVSPDVEDPGPYDVVVVGAGPAGLGAAVAAARHGCKVALIQDRPVVGGNASSEIQVPPQGYIGDPPDKVNVTGLVEEFFPPQGWGNFADSKKMEAIVRAEPNIRLFLNTRATGVVMRDGDASGAPVSPSAARPLRAGEAGQAGTIKSVPAVNVRTGRRLSFSAPLFIDCTGHGWIGYYAGAEYRMGQEARYEFEESLAPVEAGERTMGNSLYYAAIRTLPDSAVYPGVIVKYSETDKVNVAGDWIHSTFRGGDYLHDGNAGKGTKSVSFQLNVERNGRYRVFLGYLGFQNRASNVPVSIQHAGGRSTATVDQTRHHPGGKLLGTFAFEADTSGGVTVNTTGTDGYVVADYVRVLPEGEDDTPSRRSREFQCPPWAYQWTKPGDFEPSGSHRRLSEVRRPENFDRSSRGKGRQPAPGDPNGGILHAWWVELGGMQDTVTDAEKIRDELFRINIGLWNYAKNHNPRTIEANRNRELVWLNYVPGVRESRRLVGDYIMNQQDYDKQAVHQDTIAFTDWGPDVHHPEGFWVRGNDCIHVYKGRRTSIPYRTLYSRNIGNLLMAGRCHSATHIAMGGTRVMRPVMAMGQAAGTAAAIARKRRTTPRGVYQNHIDELQQALLKDGCYLPGVRNQDPDDLALKARVTASSSRKGLRPAEVIDGWNRIVGDDRNAWAPELSRKGPHWLELRLPEKTVVDTVHVTSEKQCADFHVAAWMKGEWRTVSQVSGDRRRRMVLHFVPVKTDRIRLVADGNADLFALCEVRLYNETAGRE